MGTIAFTNQEKTTVHIGNKSIAPGDTREVDETLIPKVKAAREPEIPPANPLSDMLTGNVPEIVAQLDQFDADQLGAIEQLETAGQQRKGVLTAISHQLLVLAGKPGDDAGNETGSTGDDAGNETGTDGEGGDES